VWLVVMTDETQDLASADQRPGEDALDQVLAQCIAAEEAGQPLDRQALVRRHPQLAADLAEFFANRDRMQRFAAPLRDAPQADSTPTRNGHALGNVRYFGDYELLEEIAAGGMGIVHKARQVSLNRVVAVKMILKGTLATDEDVKRFRAEAEAAANLQHPGIVAIHEVGLHEGQHYFSMDFVEGESLAERMREQPVPARDAARYVSEAAQAVHFAHQQGTLHRDLKPSNLLIDRHERVRITDFGLAKRIEDNSDLTLTGQILGTPPYMPPEQALGKRSLIGAGSDVYALGAVLYELLAGRPPFRGETPAATLRQVETLDPVSPRLLNPATPRDLETICLKCLEKEPHKRYGTAQLLAEDLDRFLRGEVITARPISSTARAWRWCKRKPAAATAALAVIIALASLVGGGWVLLDNARVGAAYRKAEEARQHAVGLSDQLQKALGDAEDARDNEATLRGEKEVALTKLESAYGMLDGQRVTTQRALDESETLRYQLQIIGADRAIQAKEISYARELLQACPASLRNWEWHYMQHLSAHEIYLCRDLANPLRDAALAPGGNSFYGVTDAGRLIHWDLAKNASLPLPENLQSLQQLDRVVVHAKTGRLAIGDRQEQLRIVDLTTGEIQLTRQLGSNLHPPPTRRFSALAFRDDGAYLAAATAGSVYVLSATDDRIWSVHRSGVRCIVLHPSQSIAILGSGLERNPANEQVPRGQWLAAWRYEEADRIELPTPESAAVTALSMNSDGVLAAGLENGAIECWHVGDTWIKAGEFQGHNAKIRDLQFCEGGQKLASASDDQTVRCWSVDELELLVILREHQAPVVALDVGGDEKSLFSAGGGTAALWSTSTRERSITCEGKRRGSQVDRLISLDVRPDGGEVAAVGLTGSIHVLDANQLTWSEIRRGRSRHSIAYGPVPDQLVLGGSPPAVFDLATGTVSGGGNTSPTSRLAVSSDRTRVAVGTAKGVAVYRLSDMALEHEFATEGGSVIDVAFLSSGKRLATASNSSMYRSATSSPTPVVAIWDVATGSRIMSLEGCTQTIWDLEASPDQRYLAAGGGNATRAAPGELKVWNADTGKLVFDFAGHQLPVWSVAFSPDGRRLASGGGVWNNRNLKGSSELKVWDLELGRQLLNLDGHAWTVMDVAFSPDGQRLYSASEDGTIRVWPGITGTPKAAGTPEKSQHTQANVALRLGSRFAEEQMWEQAIVEYSRALQLQSDLLAAWKGRAGAHFKLGRWDAAIADYRESLRLDPLDALAQGNLANALRNKQDHDAAIAEYAKAIQLDSKRAELHHEMGKTLVGKQAWPQAVAAYSAAIELQPYRYTLRQDRAWALSRGGHWDDSIADCREVLRLKPDDPWTLELLARNLRSKGQPAEAAAECRKLIELAPRRESAHLELGLSLAAQQLWEEAIASYREAIRLKPEHGEAHLRMGVALRRLGRYPEAIAAYEEAVRLNPQSASECNYLAWLLASCPKPELRDPKRAVELARRATELAPENLAYWNTLGVALYRTGDWSGTIAALEKSQELDHKGFALGHNALFLAMSHWQLGDWEMAYAWYEEGVDFADRNKEALAKDERGEEIVRFRAEAAELMGIDTKK
jgi:WD40 repeat protein/tetratricopeptide (TPR) repeat protein